MKFVSLVTLDCTKGQVRRYARIAGNKPFETGRRSFDDWEHSREILDDPEVFGRFWGFIQDFRTAWTPPEDPGPRPTPPLRSAKRMARAA